MTNAWPFFVERDQDDPRIWLAHATHDERIHTWGRSLPEIVQRAREALELWLERDVAQREVLLIIEDDDAAQLAAEARERYDKARRAYQATLRSAAHRLVEERSLSYRDAAAVLSVSKDRVAQLVHAADERADDDELQPSH